MARVTEASRRNNEAIRLAVNKIIADDPSALWSPFLAGRVVKYLRRSNPQAIAYMSKHCGGSHVQVSAVLDLTVRRDRKLL